MRHRSASDCAWAAGETGGDFQQVVSALRSGPEGPLDPGERLEPVFRRRRGYRTFPGTFRFLLVAQIAGRGFGGLLAGGQRLDYRGRDR